MKTKEILFRAPEDLAAQICATFSGYTARGNGVRIAPGCAAYTHRFSRREHFNKAELLEIQGLINSEGQDSITGKVLGGERTLAWIRESLQGGGGTP
jgi:hypothetical protein